MVKHDNLNSHMKTHVSVIDAPLVVRLTKIYSGESDKREIAKFKCSLCKALTSSMSYHLKKEHKELCEADKKKASRESE